MEGEGEQLSGEWDGATRERIRVQVQSRVSDKQHGSISNELDE